VQFRISNPSQRIWIIFRALLTSPVWTLMRILPSFFFAATTCETQLGCFRHGCDRSNPIHPIMFSSTLSSIARDTLCNDLMKGLPWCQISSCKSQRQRHFFYDRRTCCCFSSSLDDAFLWWVLLSRLGDMVITCSSNVALEVRPGCEEVVVLILACCMRDNRQLFASEGATLSGTNQ